MSRIAKQPLDLPQGVEFKIEENIVHIKGQKGSFTHLLHPDVSVELEGKVVRVIPAAVDATAARKVGAKRVRPALKVEDSAKKRRSRPMPPMVGTTRQLLGNMVKGVTEGFVVKLKLVGVGYRAKAQGQTVELSLGYSHPIKHVVPAGITVETPSNTEIVIRGADKQVVGHQAAVIRSFREPEQYKGKGILYSTERIVLKETKKK